MFDFGFNSGCLKDNHFPLGSYNLTVGSHSGEYGFDSSFNVGDLTPPNIMSQIVLSFVSSGADTLVMDLDSDFIPGYPKVDATLNNLGLVFVLVEDNAILKYKCTYVGIRSLLAMENTKTIPLQLVPRPADNALFDKYGAYLIDDNNKSLIY